MLSTKELQLHKNLRLGEGWSWQGCLSTGMKETDFTELST